MKKTCTLLLLLLAFQAMKAQTADFYFNVLSPSSIYTSIDTSEFSTVATGWGWDGLLDGNVTGELVYAPEGFSGLHTLCDSTFEDFAGKLVLVQRGECEFGQKVLNAEAQGAVAVIIANSDENVIQMGPGQTGPFISIPVIMLKQSDAAPIVLELESGATVMAELSATPNPVAIIEGTVVSDENDNCESDTGEPTLSGWRVEAEKNGFVNYTYTNADGGYIFFLDTGTYALSLVPPANGLWAVNCPGPSVSFSAFDSTVVDLQAAALMDCPQLSVDIETPLVRRCFDTNNYWVSYCNYGTATAEDAHILVSLDPLTTIVQASVPYIDLGSNQFKFIIGDVGVGECGSIYIQYEVSCDAMFGEAVCATAEIFPDTLCVQPSNDWTGASIVVDGGCDGEQVFFSINNEGTGDMSEAAEFRIIRNGELFDSGTFQLDGGASQNFTFEANGSTYRLEAGQVPFFPETTLPAATVEGCLTGGGEFEVGFVTMFPAANYGENFDEECEEVIGSYDPNDKNASPKGYGDEHFIEPNTDITYLIRFQNTGTDTAFNIKIRDTLSVLLDPSSVRPESSSHTYEFELEDENIAVFSFRNIMLPDSNVNEAGSHGYVSFTVSQKEDVELGSQILNSAAIYFDFNAPIITNEYWHTIGKDFLPSATVTVLRPGLEVSVFPNPIAETATFDLHGALFAEGEIQFFDAMGRQASVLPFDQPRFDFHRGVLPSGNYFFKILLDGAHVASGQVLVE